MPELINLWLLVLQTLSVNPKHIFAGFTSLCMYPAACISRNPAIACKPKNVGFCLSICVAFYNHRCDALASHSFQKRIGQFETIFARF